MREYIGKKLGVERSVYYRVKALLRDYNRLCRERLNILYGSPAPSDGMPRGGCERSPTEDKAVRLAVINADLEAIEQSAAEMRGKYSGRVLDEWDPVKAYWDYGYFNYIHIQADPSSAGPSRSTWTRYKYDLTRKIAEKKKY